MRATAWLPPALPALLALLALLAGCAAGSFDWQGREDPLEDYQRSFAAALGDRFDAAATHGALLARLDRVRVLWLGDHHRHEALHRRHRELLEEILRDGRQHGRQLCLGLEAVGEQDQQLVDDYLAGRRDLSGLVAAAAERWPGTWLGDTDVDTDHYRALLEFARRSGTPVFALEPAPRLPILQRDAVIAAAVRTAAARHPDRLVVAVIGQDHLLGRGDLVRRTGLPALALGAVPTPELRADAARRETGAGFLRSSGGLWFFADLLGTGGQ